MNLFKKSSKLDNVLYDVRGPVQAHRQPYNRCLL